MTLVQRNVSRINLVTFLLLSSLFPLLGCSLDATLFKKASGGLELPSTPENPVYPALSKQKFSFNGPVTSHIIDGNTAYLAGSFTSIGKSTSGPVFIDTNNVTKDLKLGLDGLVYTSATDSQGRIYIYGPFTAISGQTRKGLARLNPDGSFDDSFPDMALEGLPYSGGRGYGIKIFGSTAYIIGEFTSIKGQQRLGGAAFDIDNFSLKSWDPRMPDVGTSLEVVDSQKLAITDSSSYGNDFTGLSYVDASGHLQNVSTNLRTSLPGFSLSSVLPDGTGKYYLFSNTSVVRLLANGQVDTAFGEKTISSWTLPFLFKNEIYVLTGSPNVKVVRYSTTDGSQLGEAPLFTTNCGGSTSIAPGLKIVGDEAHNRIFVSTNCPIKITEGGVTTDRPYGFAAFDVSAGTFTLNSFDPAFIVTGSTTTALLMDMQTVDGVLYLDHFYNGVAAFDLNNNLNSLFTVSSAVTSWPVIMEASAEGLYIAYNASGSPASTRVYSFNSKTGAAVSGKLAPGVDVVTLPGYLQDLYHNGSKLFVSPFKTSTTFATDLLTFFVFNLDGTRNDVPVPNTVLKYLCTGSMKGSGFPGICFSGPNMGGTRTKGLYVYDTVTQTVDSSRDAKFPESYKAPKVRRAYFDSEYEAFVIEASYDYDPATWASPYGGYGRLYVYRVGETTPLIVQRISLSNSDVGLARHGNKLLVSGLAYISDIAWTNTGPCTGICKELSGLTAIDLTTGTVIDGYGSGLASSGTTSNNYYQYKIFVSGDKLHICHNGNGSLWLYNAATGVEENPGYSFQSVGSNPCGARLSLANGNVFFGVNNALLYDKQTTSNVIALDLESGAITDLQITGTVDGFIQLGKKIFISASGMTSAFGQAVTSPLVTYDTVSKSGAEVDLSGFQGVLTGALQLSGDTSHLVIFTSSYLGFMNLNSDGTVTAVDQIFATAGGTFKQVATNQGQVYLYGDLQDILTGNISTATQTGSYPSAGSLFRISLSDLSGHVTGITFVESTYGAALQLPTSLKVIDDSVYIVGLESANGVPQSIARLHAATGVLDTTFKPFVTFPYAGLNLNSLVMDFVKNPSGDLDVVGLFTATVAGNSIANAVTVDSDTGVATGASSTPGPSANLAALEFLKVDFSKNGEPLVFSQNASTSLFSLTIY